MGNNAAISSGGAMYLTSYTQVYLSQGSSFNFINNTGRYIHMFKIKNACTVAICMS